jgi:RNA polymerase sigma-70 factor (ECF subfamily)
LEQAVLTYRDEWLIERGFHRLKGVLLSLDPLFFKRDDQVVGLTNLLSIAVLFLTLIEFVIRRKLKQDQETLTGPIENNPKKGIDNPTAERLLKTFDNVTLSIVHLPDQPVIRHIAPRNPLRIRLLGDFELAEDALQEAFRAAMEQWPRDGIPANPQAWLVSTGRFKGIDSLRHHSRSDVSLDGLDDLAERLVIQTSDNLEQDSEDIQDDRLRLIFTCSHPALPADTRVALTLREVSGLTTDEIAHAFLTSPTTLAQRIVRAKAKLRDDHIPYQVPARKELPERLGTVLQVIYLVFNEGYSSSGQTLTRPDLSGEAIQLGRLLMELLPDPEVAGLLALMLLHESRRATRSSPEGDLILLEDQDRSRWNRELIAEATVLLERVLLSSHQFGPYGLQAAIAAIHSAAATVAATDWSQIIGLYDKLAQMTPSPVIEINRAVAVAMRDGPANGLALIDNILTNGKLADYHLAHSARAELCRRLGKTVKARTSYQRALALAKQEPERRYIEQRLVSLPN